MTELRREDFGDDFTWGVAHAAYQVEGAWDADDKGPSIWDTFTHGGGRVFDKTNGDVATDFYHRYPEDLALVRAMGFDAQRFSISWPRVLPDGVGRVSTKGLDFYSRVVDTCLELGIEPWVTLYHWDLPEALHRRGGWANRDSVEWFGELADAVVGRLGDRVTRWMVFNEPGTFLPFGYLLGGHAPGVRSLRRFQAAVHHVGLAQGRGAAAIRAAAPGASVGTTHIFTPPDVAGDRPRHRRAARAFDAAMNRVYVEPSLGLGYPMDDAPLLRGIERYVRGSDEADLVVDWDFLGVQYYQRFAVAAAPVPGLRFVPLFRKDHKRFDITAMGWEVDPTGLSDVLRTVHGYGKVPELFVTENGAAYPDHLVDGRVHDVRRTAYYRDHLAEVARARREGVPVHGYFCWSYCDNFEWAAGLRPRFGLVHVDYETQRRTVKDSGYWFSRLLGGTVTPG
ncbi:beta-glucosidase [Iamia sp. SCSIO 61187]|uniref:GH1 family beta-glucosidase n=1 Tax=Iamia sp. SCSIO 61187 TaxID=2722752 RepID=UPI001C6281FC|nr:GH1 family beta-glucosidase [Iamia sp. SCSIO 61187]QYG92153.1 beta-glucosidase [Iamia sp. SCSIO 61187]